MRASCHPAPAMTADSGSPKGTRVRATSSLRPGASSSRINVASSAGGSTRRPRKRNRHLERAGPLTGSPPGGLPEATRIQGRIRIRRTDRIATCRVIPSRWAATTDQLNHPLARSTIPPRATFRPDTPRHPNRGTPASSDRRRPGADHPQLRRGAGHGGSPTGLLTPLIAAPIHPRKDEEAEWRRRSSRSGAAISSRAMLMEWLPPIPRERA